MYVCVQEKDDVQWSPRLVALYVAAAVFDLEANYCVVKAYQYTAPTSVVLIDCTTIPIVVVLTWLFFGTRYSRLQVRAAACVRASARPCVCMAGAPLSPFGARVYVRVGVCVDVCAGLCAPLSCISPALCTRIHLALSLSLCMCVGCCCICAWLASPVHSFWGWRYLCLASSFWCSATVRCARAHTHTHTHTHAHTHTRTHTHTHTHTHIYIYIYTYLYPYTHVHVHT